MKSIVITGLTLFGAVAAHAQAVKPGTISALLFESTITTENAPANGNLPGGGTRQNHTTSSVRFINRDILEAMRVAALLDGTLTGWTLNRLADASNVGNLYATKPGKTAVAVPANLLTQPVAQGTATTGTIDTPTGGTPRQNLFRRLYGTLDFKGTPVSALGNRILKTANFRNGTTNTPVVTQIEHIEIAGKSPTGTGIVEGTYRIPRAVVGNLTPHLPGAAVP